MKFEFNWLSGFLENYAFNMKMGLQYERPWLIDQRSTLTFVAYTRDDPKVLIVA